MPDPKNPQSLNRYSYVHNNPMGYTDPTGRCGYDPSDSRLNNLLGLCGPGSQLTYPVPVALALVTPTPIPPPPPAVATPCLVSGTLVTCPAVGGSCDSPLGFTCEAAGAIKGSVGDILEGLGDCHVGKIIAGSGLVVFGTIVTASGVWLTDTVVSSEIAAAPETEELSLFFVPHTFFATSGLTLAGLGLTVSGGAAIAQAHCFAKDR